MIRINKQEVIFILSFIVFMSIILSFSKDIIASALVMIFIFIFGWYSLNFQKNIYMILFLVSFFAFLMGRPMMIGLFGVDNMYYSVPISDAINEYTWIVMIFSLISLALGYSFLGNLKLSGFKNKIVRNNSVSILKIKRICKWLMITSCVCVMLNNLEKGLYVFSYGYLASYTSYSSSLSGILLGFSQLMPMITAMYFATLPTKYELRNPLIIYLLTMVSYFITGVRYEAISAILVVFLYFELRNKIDDEKWIKRKHILLCIATIPLLMILLILISSWRLGGARDISILLIGDFFTDIGGSSIIIGYERMYHEILETRNMFFSFGNVWRSLNGNAIVSFLGGEQVYLSQTVENAIYGHSLSAAVSYETNPARYISGGGLGSCYIAELMCDFSYTGLIIGNIIIGIIIRRLSNIHYNNLVGNFLTIFIAMSLFRIPRDSVDYFFYQLIGIKSTLFLLLIYFIYNKSKNYI